MTAAEDGIGEGGPLRVAVVSRRVHPAHGPGGMERHVFDLVRQAAARGVRVDLYTETPAEPERATALSAALPDGVTAHLVPGGWLPIGRRPGTVVLDRITNYPLWARRVGRWVRQVEEGPGSWTGIEVPPEEPRSPLALVHAHGLAGWGFAGEGSGSRAASGSSGASRASGGRSAAPPLVLTPHGMEEFQVPPGPKRWAYAPFRSWMRAAAAAADVVVAMDRSLEPLVERHLGAAADRRVTLPNAVDPAALRAAADAGRGRELLERWGLAGARPLFLSVGRVAPNKGYDVMVRALARAELPGTAWILVGDGPAAGPVEAQARATGLLRAGGTSRGPESSRARGPSRRPGSSRAPDLSRESGSSIAVLAGRLPDADVRALCAVADWFVHPTLYEGSSIVTLEAMAHGLPVIASRTGGLPDKVEDGVTGFLVPPGDEEALAAALARASEVDARAMGAAGRDVCERRFSWEAVGAAYVRLYRRLAAGRYPATGPDTAA